MRKFFLLATVAFSVVTKAQIKEGKVVYERTMQMPAITFGGNLPAGLQSQIQEQLPKSRIDQFELLFNSQHSLYQFLPNAADDGKQHLCRWRRGNAVCRR